MCGCANAGHSNRLLEPEIETEGQDRIEPKLVQIVLNTGLFPLQIRLEGRIVETADVDAFFQSPRDPRTAAFVRGEMVY